MYCQTNFVVGPVSYAFGACKCETSVGSETCPEASFWWPDGGVGNFFVMTQWVPGQVGSDYQASFLYRDAGGGWSSTKLTHATEEVLDFGLDDSEPVVVKDFETVREVLQMFVKSHGLMKGIGNAAVILRPLYVQHFAPIRSFPKD